MRKKLKLKLFEEFSKTIEEWFPGFTPTDDPMRMSERAFVMGHQSGWFYFVFLSTLDKQDCFDVDLGIATKGEIPWTESDHPADPLENGARRFAASYLFQEGGVPVYWCIEPTDPMDLDQLLKPPSPVERLLPRVKTVVNECFQYFAPAFREYIEATSREPLPSAHRP